MTKRLEDAIKQLSPEQLEQLTRYVESIAQIGVGTQDDSDAPRLSWIGSLKDGPYRSGLEAQEAAKHRRIFLLERGLAK